MTKTNLKDIIGDSKGTEAAKKIAEWATKNCTYTTYEPTNSKPELKPKGINCSDREENPIKKKKRIQEALRDLGVLDE